jgi:hypothetical protein
MGFARDVDGNLVGQTPSGATALGAPVQHLQVITWWGSVKDNFDRLYEVGLCYLPLVCVVADREKLRKTNQPVVY